MGKRDEETGIEPVATDGEPDTEAWSDDEIERRRQLRAAREREEERQVGAPIDGQNPDTGEEDDGQLFVYDGSRKVSLGSLIPKGKPVEHAIVFGSASRKGTGSLIGFEEDVLLVVRGKVASVKPEVTRNDDETVKSVTIRTQINPKVIAAADSEQAMDMLAEVFAKRGISKAA